MNYKAPTAPHFISALALYAFDNFMSDGNAGRHRLLVTSRVDRICRVGVQIIQMNYQFMVLTRFETFVRALV